MDFIEFGMVPFDSPKVTTRKSCVSYSSNSPTKSSRKSVKKEPMQQTRVDHVDIEYQRIEEAKKPDSASKVVVYVDGNGQVNAVFESSLQPAEESLVEINQSLNTSRMFYKAHAIANTLLLSGAFCRSPDELLSISALYFCWCAGVYAAFSVDTNQRCLASHNSEVQTILKELSLFQRTQACLNMLAGGCFMGGVIAEELLVGYLLGGVVLAAAVGNSFLFL